MQHQSQVEQGNLPSTLSKASEDKPLGKAKQAKLSLLEELQGKPSAFLESSSAMSLLLPYLKLNQKLKLTSLSKGTNFTIRKQLRSEYLSECDSRKNELELLKEIYSRKVSVLNCATNELQEIPVAAISLTCGDGFGVVSDLSKKHFFFSLATRPLSLQQLNYEGVHCHGAYLFGWTGRNLQIFKRQQKVEPPFSFEEPLAKIQLEEPIITIKQSSTHSLVLGQNKAYIVCHQTMTAKLFALPAKAFGNSSLCLFQGRAFWIEDGQLVEMALSTEQKSQPKCTMEGKNIVSVHAGQRHIIVQQYPQKLSRDWNTEDLQVWAGKEGFQDYVNIFKAERIDGPTLLGMESDELQKRLGMINNKVQQKLKLKITESNEVRQSECVTYGWGLNSKGQLGSHLPRHLDHPTKLKLPKDLELIKCIGNRTYARNPKDESVLVTGFEEAGKFDWKKVPVEGQIYLMESPGTFIVTVMHHESDKEKDKPKRNRLRPAKEVLSQIQWDSSLNREEFTVGYMDRYEGTQEISFDGFKEADVKEHRIEYFKRKGKIVWSKNQRIDLF